MVEFKQLTFEDFLSSYKKPQMGISTGLSGLDNLFFGFHPGNLYMVGGSSGMGKTALFVDFILSAAKEVPVGFISMEMTIPELKERMICRIADVHSQSLKAATLEPEDKKKVDKAIKHVTGLHTISIVEQVNCFYPDWLLEKKQPENSIEYLIESWSQQGCKIFFIDYLQMSELAEKVDREDIKIKKQCEKLKKLAKKYHISIVAAVQLSGAPDERHAKGEDPKPIMRDLWGSVFIRAAADVIMLVYREEYYAKQELNSIFERSRERSWIIVPKHRSGSPNVEVPLFFKPYCTSFEDADNTF